MKKPPAKTNTDQIDLALSAIPGQIPTARILSSESDRIALIKSCGGPRTAMSIRKAQKHAPISRIPHLFNSIDTQVVVDILSNDLDELITQMLKK